MKKVKIETGETTPLENEPKVSELVEAPVEMEKIETGETTPLENEPTVSELVERSSGNQANRRSSSGKRAQG